MAGERVKRLIKLWVPPILVGAAKALSGWDRGKAIADGALEYAPKGWDTPPTDAVTGWNTPGVSAAAEAKWAAFCENARGSGPLGFSFESANQRVIRDVHRHNVHISFAYVLALAAHHRDRLSVLDWGSALGHYHAIACAVLPGVEFDYHCKDMPRMVERGKVLNPKVTWWADDRCLERTYDLVVVSGSLQCIREWREFIPKAALAVEPGGYFLLTRLPVVEGAPFVAIQRLYGTAMLHQQFNEQEILAHVASTGLRLIRELVVGYRHDVVGAPEPFELKGWLFRKDHAKSSC